ncbi:tubulin-specific chaperone c [Diplodia corticola]|uniref:Tubulin-specific chaperone c n=1 Tax=Diplodia corticola TaxID=236234 RepID=A0A1J9R5V6_9PEZI|nr:tubulin-specific chaperone c [Diplodia corticola]OJD35594.1 tubulin-specific chaperone c [Diplodia corticola]
MALPLQQPADSGLKERFFRYFQHEVTELQEEINTLANKAVTGGERADGVEHCLAGIARLSREVKDASSYIPAYDQRTYSEAIKALNDKLNQTRASFAPRSKFSFKSTRQSSATTAVSHHKNSSAISLADVAELASQQRLKLPGAHQHAGANDPTASSGDTSTAESSAFASPAAPGTPANESAEDGSSGQNGAGGLDDRSGGAAAGQDGFVNRHLSSAQQQGSPMRKPSFSGTSSVAIAGHTGLHIILPPTASHATSAGTIANVRRCIVDMSQPTAEASGGAPFAGLTVKNVRDSLLVCGRVAGAIHVTAVEGSVLVVRARQFRMHECKNVDVYLRCDSRPIIEDCAGIRFAPLPETYTHEDSSAQPNLWDQVDDFKWLKAEHSPNWSVLPPDTRISEHVWKDLVPGSPDMGLEEIFQAVKIQPKH